MIQCIHIKKSFPLQNHQELTVLRDINLSVEPGEMLAIKGASGSGKSTLLHILGCLDRPDTGTYLLDGTDTGTLSGNRLATLRNEKIGFVMQHFSLIEEESALRNVEIPLLFAENPVWHSREKAYGMLEKLSIAHLADRRVSRLSGGEKQRVAIARALVREPSLLLADEPTGALDSANAAAVMEILHSLHREGKTILIVTHDDSIASQCSRTVLIRDGEIKAG